MEDNVFLEIINFHTKIGDSIQVWEEVEFKEAN